MDSLFTIDFTGLCAIVTNGVPESLHVILATDPQGKMKHRPILSINTRNVAHVEHGSFDQVIQLPSGEQIASWGLDDCIVRLTDNKTLTPRGVRPCGMGIPASSFPQNPISEMELCWVPSLKRASDEGKVKSIYLAPEPDPKPEPSALAARVDLKHGYLYANAAVNRRSPFEVWSFPKAHGAYSQYLADTVRLELHTQTKKIPAIEIVNFKTDAKRTIELEQDEKLTELSITNFPHAMPEHGHDHSKLVHFGIYYELLDPSPGSRPIPENPIKQTPGSGSMAAEAGDVMTVSALGIRPVKCTPGMVP